MCHLREILAEQQNPRAESRPAPTVSPKPGTAALTRRVRSDVSARTPAEPVTPGHELPVSLAR